MQMSVCSDWLNHLNWVRGTLGRWRERKDGLVSGDGRTVGIQVPERVKWEDRRRDIEIIGHEHGGEQLKRGGRQDD